MKTLLLLVAAFTAAISSADSAKWIWFPGDWQIWLGNQAQLHRWENGSPMPPSIWPLYAPYPSVSFVKDVDFAEPEEVSIAVEGLLHITGIPGEHPVLGDRYVFPKGKYRITAQVYSADKAPALFIDGAHLKTGDGWSVNWYNGENVPAEWGSFDKISAPPSSFRLATEPKSAVKQGREGDVYFADFGEETIGFVKLHGVKGKGRVKLIYGESEAEARDNAKAEYYEIVDLDGNGEDYTTGDSHALRCLCAYPVSGDVAFEKVSLLYEYLPLERKGSFRCNDEELNRIWDVSARTLHLTAREVLLDGIKRDRWAWSGDAYQSFLMNWYLFGDKDIVQRTLLCLRGKDPVARHLNSILDYTFYWFAGVDDYYQFTGDTAFLRRLWPKMVTLMDFCLARLDANGMFSNRPGDWVFIDWAPEQLHNYGGATCFEQILFVRALEAMASCAAAIDKDSKTYADRATALRKQIVPRFWNEEKGALMHLLKSDGTLDDQLTRYPNMFALFNGYFDNARAEKIADNVLLNPSVMSITTPYMRFWELEALCSLKMQQRVLGEIKDYWGGMLKLGATSFWELYDPKQSGSDHLDMYGRKYCKSLCHAWGASPLYLLGRYWLGVRPLKPGFAEYEVSPNLGGLEWMEGDVPTPNGKIHIRMDSASVSIQSDEGNGTLLLDGKAFAIAPGVRHEFKRK